MCCPRWWNTAFDGRRQAEVQVQGCRWCWRWPHLAEPTRSTAGHQLLLLRHRLGPTWTCSSPQRGLGAQWSGTPCSCRTGTLRGQDTECVCACHPRHLAHGESSTGWGSLQRPPSTPQLSSGWYQTTSSPYSSQMAWQTSRTKREMVLCCTYNRYINDL